MLRKKIRPDRLGVNHALDHALEGSFVINVGDMLARWTNDVSNSTPHRVIPPADFGDRYSMARFFDPSVDAVIRCVPQFVSTEQPAKQESIV